MNKIWKRALGLNNRGQTLTEFLFVLVILVFLVLAHIQFSLTYVVSSFIRYTTFMAARSESVEVGSSMPYVEAMVGTPGASKLSPVAHILDQAQMTASQKNQFSLPYEVLSYVPLFGPRTEGVLNLKSESPISYEPVAQPLGEFFDNE